MKKLIMAMLALSLVLIVGCGGDDADKKTTDKTTTTTD